jgi:CheY-like chemotaxis protein
MTKRVLWLDDDLARLDPFIATLSDSGYEVDAVGTVSEAEYFLRTKKYGLLILDVMIPTVSEDEEKRYDPNSTNRGLKTGLIFYDLHKEVLEKARIHVLVMTVILDKEIRDDFIRAGLPHDCFATKYELRDVSVFLNTVQRLY